MIGIHLNEEIFIGGLNPVITHICTVLCSRSYRVSCLAKEVRYRARS